MNSWLRQIDRTNALVALGVWLAALVVYLRTMAPTVTFWDCGEFIAVSYILGIPHPPGTPLFVLIGKLATWNPFISEPAARINFLSALSSSISALFAYLCGVRIMRHWFANDGSSYSKFLTFAGAAAGALFLAWGKTQWFNSTEAEVYGLAMLIFLAAFWLTLIYFDTPESPMSNRLMLAVIYLAFLGIGAHMTTFLVLPICALFFILKRDTPVRYWFMAAVAVFLELYLIFALSSRPDEVPYYVSVLTVFIIYLLYIFTLPVTRKELLFIAVGFLVSIAPLFGVVADVVRTGQIAKSAGTGPLYILGMIGVIATILLGLWVLAVYFRERKASRLQTDNSSLVGALFVLAMAIMVIFPALDLRGYGTFIFLSIVVIGVLGLLLWHYIRWANFIAIVGISLVMIGIYKFFWGLVIAAAVLAFMGLMKLPGWKTGLLILAAAVLGFSVHLFLPIRAAEQPYINENGIYQQGNLGQTIRQTVGFLERKQYGSQSMTERMFQRRAEWANQFGTWRRMGYWGFFQEQYGINNRQFFIVLMLGVFGLWEAVRRRSQVGLALTLIVILSSIGLVLYMNFADGTRQSPVTGADYIEVRDRDYFFTPAYMFFGLAIGLGITALIQFVREVTAKLAAIPRKALLAVLSVLFLLPAVTLASNYWQCDRSRNWIAYDYANNLLQTADKNAAYFTYGDNDTFPVWCLQEAYRIRKDVRVVNLSLANTKWYIKQVQDYMGLRLGWTERDIDNLRPYRLQDGRTFQLADILTDAVIKNNRGRVPINFSTTVPSDGRKYEQRSLDNYLTLNGLAWRLRDTDGGMQVSIDEAMSYFFDPARFRVRGLNDSTLYKDDNELRLTSSYSNAMLMLADTLRKAGRTDDVIRVLELGVANVPEDPDMLSALASTYAESGKFDRLRTFLESPQIGDKRLVQTILGRELYKAGKKSEGEAMLAEVFRDNPTYRPAFQELSLLYNQEYNYVKLRQTLSTWLQANPGDTVVANVLQELDRMAEAKRLKARDSAK